MRRVLVNAQIKAMVSLIESIMNIGYVIIVAFTVRTSFGTLVIMVSLYMVVLPYSFLMNTSHNKSRIIEHGWKNVFNNILGRKQIALNNSSDTPPAIPKENTSKHDRNDDNDLTDDQHACTNSSENQMARGKEGETDSTTNTSAQNEGERENSESRNVKRKEMNDIGKEMSEKCDSNVFVTKSSGYFPEGNDNTTVSKPSHSGVTTGTKNCDLKEAERLVLKMIEHINDEEKYSEYFKQLVSHVYSSKYGKIHPELCLQGDSLPNSVPENSSSKNPSYQGATSTQLHQRRNFRSMTAINAADQDSINGRDPLTREAKDRVLIRQKLLSQIVSTNGKNQDEIQIWRVKQLINEEKNFWG